MMCAHSSSFEAYSFSSQPECFHLPGPQPYLVFIDLYTTSSTNRQVMLQNFSDPFPRVAKLTGLDSVR